MAQVVSKTIPLAPGRYTFESLKKLMGIESVLTELGGYIHITIPPDVDITISNSILNILWMDDGGWMVAGTKHMSDYIAPITIKRNITIHLGETETIFDGGPSTMIGRVMLDNDRATHKLYATPQMHKVSGGELSVITLNIKDDDGNLINNRKQPIYVTLFIN